MSDASSMGPAIASEPPRGLSPTMAAAALANEFRAANKPRIVDGVPGESALSPDERSEWCRRLVPLARERLALAGDRIAGNDACTVTLVAQSARQLVPEIQLRLDLGFFFLKPYASASYDRESRTLFLPLAAVHRPWDEVSATRHEWIHAQHHMRARQGDPVAMALQTVITGTDYRPDGFDVDEVPVNLCDAVRSAQHGQAPGAQQLEMMDQYVRILRKELDLMKRLRKREKRTRAGVSGVLLESSDSIERWLGGTDPKRTLTTLESVWKDASTALSRLRATPPDVAGALEVRLLAGDACEPGPKR